MGQHSGNKIICNHLELLNISSMIIICRVLNNNNVHIWNWQLHTSYTDVIQWEDHFNVSEQNGGLRQPDYGISNLKCTLKLKVVDRENMR